MLVPVQTACWEAWISSAMMVARSNAIRMLVAARPSYINPVLLAKMITTFDQLSGGRICINLIAGHSEAENASEGIKWGKEERYEIMDEEVSILKALWTARGPLDFDGKFHQLKGAQIRPYPLQKPHPKFYLGGGTRQAWEISAKHSDVHLFWGDTYERIRANMAEIRAHGGAARSRGRDRLRHAPADRLPADREGGVGIRARAGRPCQRRAEGLRERNLATSEANRRVRELAASGEIDRAASVDRHHPSAARRRHRRGRRSRAVRGHLQKFIDLGCHSFCLSGYLHDEEAERFGKWVMPILRERNRERMLAA